MRRKLTNTDREAVLKLADAKLTAAEISPLTKIAKSTVHAIISTNRYAQTLSYEDFNSKLSVHASPATAAWALERNGVQIPADEDVLDNASAPLDNASAPLDNASAPLDNASAPLDNASAPLDNASAPLDNASAPLDDASAPLDDSDTILGLLHLIHRDLRQLIFICQQGDK